MTWQRAESETPLARRVVLLGASNLVRNIATVVQTACAAWGGPANVLMAAGHGRSYGRASCVFGRTLPGIVECELWQTLARQPAVPTAALVTDVGNDILYGAEESTIALWVEFCLIQLRLAGARIVMTELPLDNLRNLQAWRFRLFRTVLFPQSRLTLEGALIQAAALNKRLRVLADKYEVTLVEPQRNWYTFDPIHSCFQRQADAWSVVMSHWKRDQPASRCPGTRRNGLYLRTLRPHQRSFAGLQSRRAQPSGRLADGTQISLF